MGKRDRSQGNTYSYQNMQTCTTLNTRSVLQKPHTTLHPPTHITHTHTHTHTHTRTQTHTHTHTHTHAHTHTLHTHNNVYVHALACIRTVQERIESGDLKQTDISFASLKRVPRMIETIQRCYAGVRSCFCAHVVCIISI